jgi:sugar lactone lactonase YvrE
LWHAEKQLFYWIDILRGLVHVCDPATKHNRTINGGQPVGTVVARQAGGLMLAVKNGFASLDLDTEKMTIVADPEAHIPANRFNDGKVDPAGRFWAGTMVGPGEAVPGAGALYSLDANHQVTLRLPQVGISNGIVWTKDKTKMYFIDTLAYSVDAFDYDDATGNISNRRVLFRMPPELGYPDGMTIDSDDHIWMAVMGSGKVFCYDPEPGKLLHTIEFPARGVTSCAFCGPDLDELYVTSGNIGQSAEQLAREPHSGGLFKVKPGARGVVSPEYLG